MNLAEAYQETFGQLTPEPSPVKISAKRCAEHPDCRLVSYPRNEGEGPEFLKCPWKFCSFGV